MENHVNSFYNIGQPSKFSAILNDKKYTYKWNHIQVVTNRIFELILYLAMIVSISLQYLCFNSPFFDKKWIYYFEYTSQELDKLYQRILLCKKVKLYGVKIYSASIEIYPQKQQCSQIYKKKYLFTYKKKIQKKSFFNGRYRV